VDTDAAASARIRWMAAAAHIDIAGGVAHISADFEPVRKRVL
jgi:hypothetical protein